MNEEELGFDPGGWRKIHTYSPERPDEAALLRRSYEATTFRRWSGNHLLERFPGR